MSVGRCPRCGNRVPDEAARCPTCGFAAKDGRLQLLGEADGPSAPEPVVCTRRPPDRRAWLVVGLVAALVAALIGSRTWGGRGQSSSSTPANPTNLPTSTTTSAPTSAAGTSSLLGPSSTTTPPGSVGLPTKVPVPVGLSGRLFVLSAAGKVLAIDLAAGAATVLADVSQTNVYVGDSQNARLFALDDGLVIWRDGRVVAVPFDAALSAVTLPDILDPVVAGDHWAVFSNRPAEGGASALLVVDGTGGVQWPLDLDPSVRVVAVAGSQLVAQAADTMVLVEPLSGAAKPVGPGVVVAANAWGLVHSRCPQVTRCELHVGPWTDLNRQRIAGGRLQPAQLSADGSHLASLSSGQVVEVRDLLNNSGTWTANVGPVFELNRQGAAVAGFDSRRNMVVAALTPGDCCLPSVVTVLHRDQLSFDAQPVAVAFDSRPPH